MTDARDDDDLDAQAEYDADPDLQELLTGAAVSPTVQRANVIDNDDNDAHRDRVHEAADRTLDKDADLIQRLRDDAGDGAAWVDRLRSGSRLRDVISDDGDSDGNNVPDDPTAV